MIAEHVKGTTKGNLMRLMCLGGAPVELENITRTSDGFYIGREPGDVGYNAFIGRPQHIDNAQDSTREIVRTFWDSLSETERLQVQALAARPADGSPIPLNDFLPGDCRAPLVTPSG